MKKKKEKIPGKKPKPKKHRIAKSAEVTRECILCSSLWNLGNTGLLAAVLLNS